MVIKLKRTSQEVVEPTLTGVGFIVTAHTILKMYKGSKELDEHRLQFLQLSFQREGHINLRSFERVLVGTGVKVEEIQSVPDGYRPELQIRDRDNILLKRGIQVVPDIISDNLQNEIGITLINITPFLVEIHKSECVALVVPNLVPIIKTEI